jgi:putative phosphotransacetylase
MNGAPTRETIERIVREVIDTRLAPPGVRRVPINISARHLHIRQDHLEVLFGPGAQLTKLKDLLQPGEFAANETVAVVGPNRRAFDKVRILGPVRKLTQVELSFSDGRYLGMNLPARISGDIDGTLPVVLVGPVGAIRLEQGAIRALRHVHMSEEDVARLGLQNGQMVRIKTDGAMGVVFDNVKVRAGKNLKLEMHIDTDEGNAAGLPESSFGTILEDR